MALSRRASLALLAVLVALAAALRVIDLDRESLWLDEAFSVALGRGSLRELLTLADKDFHPPLYFILVKVWFGLVGGSSAWAARLFSVVASLAALIGTYALGAALANRATGLAAAGLLAVSPFQIAYAQEARMYALLAALAALSTLSFARLGTPEAAAPDRAHGLLTAAWWSYVLTTTALVYTQAVGGFVVLAHALAAGVAASTPRARRLAERWLTAMLAVALLFLPWLPTFGRQFLDVQRGFWIADPAPGDLPGTVAAFAGSAAAGWLLAALALAGLLARAWPADGSAPRYAMPRLLLLSTLALPLTGPYVASLVGAPIFLAKYTIAATVPLSILAAAGLMRLPRPVAAALGLTIAVLGIRALTEFREQPHKDDWRGVVARVESEAGPGDTVLFYPYFLEYPWRVYAVRPALRTVPLPEHASQLTAPTLADLLSRLAPPDGRVWLVLMSYDARRPALLGELRRDYRAVEERPAGHIDVVVAQDRRPSPVPVAPRPAGG